MIEIRTSDLPPELRTLAEEALSLMHQHEIPSPQRLKPLYDWIEAELFHNIIEEDSDKMVIRKDRLCQHCLSDSEVRDHFDLDPTAEVSDDQRIQWLRQCIEAAIARDDSIMMPSLFTVDLKSEEHFGLLGFLVEIHGHSGPVLDWLGIFDSEDQLTHELERRNVSRIITADYMSDTEILCLWEGR